MSRNEEIHMLMLALETYWKEHPEISLDNLITNIKKDIKTNKLEDRVAYNFLIENIKEDND